MNSERRSPSDNPDVRLIRELAINQRLGEYLDHNLFVPGGQKGRKTASDIRLIPFLQGVMSLPEGNIPVGAEALVRAEDVNRPSDIISAQRVLAIAGASRRRITTLTYEVIWGALRHANHLRNITRNNDFTMWANVDGDMFDSDFLSFVNLALGHHKIPGNALGLEIHESLRSPSKPEVMETLHGMGVKFAFDDLGSSSSMLGQIELTRDGLSSLFAGVPDGIIQKIKFDKDVGRLPRTRLSALPRIFHLGDGTMEITVEGVATEDDLIAVRRSALAASLLSPDEAMSLKDSDIARLIHSLLQDRGIDYGPFPVGPDNRVTVQGFHQGNHPKRPEDFIRDTVEKMKKV